MNIVKQSFDILTPISKGGMKELKFIEKVARTCYKSEDKITADGESAKKMVRMLINRGHEAMLEHSMLSVRFVCDRAIANELVRHRHCAFAQESTRYCLYTREKFGGELTFVLPGYLEAGSAIRQKYIEGHLIKIDQMSDEEYQEYRKYEWWEHSCMDAENTYKAMANSLHMPAEQCRDALPLSTKTELVVTTNYREWRNILKLRTAPDAHPQMRSLMLVLLTELQEKLPVIFDDIGDTSKE